MSKKEFIGLVVLVCLLNFLLQIWYVGNAGDFIANYVGYPISVFIIPIFLSQLLPYIALSACSKSLALKQKLQLFGIPCFVSVCLVCGWRLILAIAYNKQIMSLAAARWDANSCAASPLLHTCLRPIFGSYIPLKI